MHTDDPDDQHFGANPERPSKSQRKRESTQLQELGEMLVALTPELVRKLELPEALLDAVLAAQKIHEHGGKRRQLQYVGRIMRDVETDELRARLLTLRDEVARGQHANPRRKRH